MVQSGGNGKSEEPQVEVTFEHLDDETMAIQDRWIERDETTGERKITFSSEMRDKLEIEEEDEESESD